MAARRSRLADNEMERTHSFELNFTLTLAGLCITSLNSHSAVMNPDTTSSKEIKSKLEPCKNLMLLATTP